MSALIEQLAQQHLRGALPASVVELLRPLDNEGPDVVACVRRAFALMERAHFRPEDFSRGLAWAFSQIGSGLPAAWGGMIPQVTFPGRLATLDEYLAVNPWGTLPPGGTLLDIGCGFPPHTTVDSARRFPDAHVLGIDPMLADCLVYDTSGDYACFATDGTLRYFQAGDETPERYAALVAEPEATHARFTALRDDLLPFLPAGTDYAETQRSNGRIVRSPLAAYTTAQLEFRDAAIGSEGIPLVDVARCMNVLLYFDDAYADAARRWVHGLLKPGGLLLHGVCQPLYGHYRYFVWRREQSALVPREFALSLDGLRSMLPIDWYSLHDSDREGRTRADVLGALWSADPQFRHAFDRALDAILAEADFHARGPDGVLGMAMGKSPAEFRDALHIIDERLNAGGWAERAAAVLRRTGKDAWQNAAGHLAVDPLQWGWTPVTV